DGGGHHYYERAHDLSYPGSWLVRPAGPARISVVGHGVRVTSVAEAGGRVRVSVLPDTATGVLSVPANVPSAPTVWPPSVIPVFASSAGPVSRSRSPWVYDPPRWTVTVRLPLLWRLSRTSRSRVSRRSAYARSVAVSLL